MTPGMLCTTGFWIPGGRARALELEGPARARGVPGVQVQAGAVLDVRQEGVHGLARQDDARKLVGVAGRQALAEQPLAPGGAWRAP